MAQSNQPAGDEDMDETLSKDALYARATELKIPGRRRMNRDDLEDAVRKAEKAAGGPPTKAKPAATEGAEGEGATEGQPPPVATPEQVNKIMGASNEQLEGLVGDPELAPHLKVIVVQEIGRRTEKAQAEATRNQARGSLERYVVTKGGRYITRDGFGTDLPKGSVVTTTSHDLAHVRSQGIEITPAESVTIVHDELGNQHSRAH